MFVYDVLKCNPLYGLFASLNTIWRSEKLRSTLHTIKAVIRFITKSSYIRQTFWKRHTLHSSQVRTHQVDLYRHYFQFVPFFGVFSQKWVYRNYSNISPIDIPVYVKRFLPVRWVFINLFRPIFWTWIAAYWVYIFSAFQLPKYDYLYIDLNFLIHKATTDKGLLPLEEVDSGFYSEPRIFERILRYIETLHRIIPSKVLFLSIDGVAPRAKWATQRERRYCTFVDHINSLGFFFHWIIWIYQ